jgi:hypothetical protein
MLPHSLRTAALLFAGASLANAQTPDDGLMMSKGMATGGIVYVHDQWDEYWEGTLKRSNGNIGTLTTRAVTVFAGYGITDRLGVMAALPYVSTEASQGTLQDQSGVQDLTVAVKYRLMTAQVSNLGALSAFVVGTGAIPMSDYTPDFMPLSIGTSGGRASGRLTLGFQSTSAWFVNLSGAYTWCANVTLDRSSYYTDGHLYMSNEVSMPSVVDYTLTAGFASGKWRVPVSLTQQRTQGGGDIRRQDMPFVSNRMDFTRLHGAVTYAMPKRVALHVGAARVLDGRNVGQSTTISTGVAYAFHF